LKSLYRLMSIFLGLLLFFSMSSFDISFFFFKKIGFKIYFMLSQSHNFWSNNASHEFEKFI
jgi:hypothetical protein